MYGGCNQDRIYLVHWVAVKCHLRVCVCVSQCFCVCPISHIGRVKLADFPAPHMHATALTRLDYKLDRKMVCLTPCIHLIFKTCVSYIIFYARLSYMNMSLTHSPAFFLFRLFVVVIFFRDCWFDFFSHRLVQFLEYINAFAFSQMTRAQISRKKGKKLRIDDSNNNIGSDDAQKSFYLISN